MVRSLSYIDWMLLRLLKESETILRTYIRVHVNELYACVCVCVSMCSVSVNNATEQNINKINNDDDNLIL